MFAIAGVYGTVTLIGGGLICAPIQRRLLRKKGVEIKHFFRKWNYGVCGVMALIFADFAVMFARLTVGSYTGNIGHIEGYMVQSGIIGLLAVVLIVCLVSGMLYWYKRQITDTKKEKAKYIVTVIMAIVMFAVVARFDMYQFWAI